MPERVFLFLRRLVVLFLLLWVGLAVAQPSDASKLQAVYEEASRYYKTQDYEKALEKFKEAYHLSRAIYLVQHRAVLSFIGAA